MTGFSGGSLKRKENSTVESVEKHVVVNLVKERMIPPHEVPDPAFMEGILGVGATMIPAEGCVYAPIDGTVVVAFPTGHAIGLMSDDGMEVLAHAGINMVAMKGDDFNLKAEQGDRVTGGQLLLTFKPEKIEVVGYETTIMVLVSSTANLSAPGVPYEGDTGAGQELYCLRQGRKSMNLETIRIYNSNVIVTHDEDGQEMIAIGKGLAFTKKSGETVDTEGIEELSMLRDKVVTGRLGQLMKDTPPTYLEIRKEIVRMLEEKLDMKLNEGIYLTLIDHVSLSLERERDGIVCENPLLVDIKHFYKREFGSAKGAVAIIEREMEVAISEDGIGLVTSHIVNASMDQQFYVIMEATWTIPDTLAIVEDYFGSIMDEESLNYQ